MDANKKSRLRISRVSAEGIALEALCRKTGKTPSEMLSELVARDIGTESFAEKG